MLRETVGDAERNATAGRGRGKETSALDTCTRLIWSHYGEVVSQGTHQGGFKSTKEASSLLSEPKETVSGCNSEVLSVVRIRALN